MEADRKSLYDSDFNAWTRRTAELLRAGRLGEIDLDQAAAEIEDMGKRDARELQSRMRVLLRHLLKWAIQPERRSASWRTTIDEQREVIVDLLAQSPSLRQLVAPRLGELYRSAVRRAARETALDASRFPTQCPYTLDQILDENFLPN